MPASATVSSTRIDVAPGSSTTTELTVRNVGSVVDEFSVEVLGPAAAWTTASPASVPLFPGASAAVVLTFAPPRRADVAAGEMDVAVKVHSREDPDGSYVEEFVIVMGAYDQPDAELVPRTVRGGRKAKAQLAVDNLGNRRSNTEVSAFDPDNKLQIRVDPQSFVVEPGRAEFVQLHIRPTKTFMRGMEKTHQYRVTLDYGDSTATLDGTYVQTPLLPRWLSRLLGMLLVGLLALFLLWQFAFKPVIRSAAKEATSQQVEAAATKAAVQTAVALGAPQAKIDAIKAGAKDAVGSEGGKSGGESGKADAAPGGSGSDANQGSKTGDAAGASTNTGTTGREGTPLDHRITVEAAPGQSAETEWMPGGDKDRFSLTDIILQNPQGDVGVVRLKRGDDVLLESALENFRDIDFHFIAPYVAEGKPLKLAIDCKNAVEGGQPCRNAATLGGFIVVAPK